MSHKLLFVTLPAVSLVLSGFTSALAQEPEQSGGFGWIGVLIVLILLIPLVWWLMRSSGAKSADHGHHSTEPHAPIQTPYPLEADAVAPAPVEPAPVKAEAVAAETKEVMQNVVDQIADTAAVGADEVEAVAPTPEQVEPSFTAAAESHPTTRRAQASTKPDDLVIIEGIGPKIAHILQENGIQTFADLAEADLNRIKEILQKAGLSNIANPTTWAEQAQLAADSHWDELKDLQGKLKAGRRA